MNILKAFHQIIIYFGQLIKFKSLNRYKFLILFFPFQIPPGNILFSKNLFIYNFNLFFLFKIKGDVSLIPPG